MYRLTDILNVILRILFSGTPCLYGGKSLENCLWGMSWVEVFVCFKKNQEVVGIPPSGFVRPPRCGGVLASWRGCRRPPSLSARAWRGACWLSLLRCSDITQGDLYV